MNEAGKGAAVFFTLFGEQLITVALICFLYLCLDKKTGVFITVNLTAAMVWTPMLKNILVRRRPYFDHPSIRCLKPVDAENDIFDLSAQGYSMPSGHSVNAVTVYGSLAVRKKKRTLAVLAAVLSLLVGISRVCLGVHYTTDVLAGWTIGLICVGLVSYLQVKIKRKWILYLILLLTALPGCFYCHTDDYFSTFGIMIGFFAGDLFEERFVRFENTRKPLSVLLRLAGVLGIFLAVSALFKLPFSSEFLEAGTFASNGLRVLRYTVILFLAVGIYPLLFRKKAS